MSDITGRLQSISSQIAELAQLARDGESDAADKLAGELNDALERLIQELGPRQGKPTDGKAKTPKAPRRDVLPCPRCSLRALHFEKGSMRPLDDEGKTFEALYRCRSCGHSVWEEAR